MGVLKALIFVLVFLLAINLSIAATIDSYNIQYNIVNNKVLVQGVFELSDTVTGILKLPVPSDAETIEVYLNGVKTESTIENSYIIANLNENDHIRLSYITREYIDKSNFLLNMPVEFDIESLEITLVLPEEAVLRKPIKDTAGSIYPRPDKATTDGRSLIFVWEKQDLKKGDELSIFAMYKTKINYVPVIIVLVIFLALFAFGFIKKPKKYVKQTKTKKKEKEPKILEHLKEDEQQIVRLLKQRENQCEQGTLRVITGFSKAHLSRLLMELEARKIIYKEKKGKKNLIFLK